MSTGTAGQAMIEFPDLDGFYAARGDERPPEFDYGCHNVDDLAVNPVDPRPQTVVAALPGQLCGADGRLLRHRPGWRPHG